MPTTRLCFVLADLVAPDESDAVLAAATRDAPGARAFAALYAGPCRSEQRVADMLKQYLWLPVMNEPALASASFAFDDESSAEACRSGTAAIHIARAHFGTTLAVVVKRAHFERIDEELCLLTGAAWALERLPSNHPAVRHFALLHAPPAHSYAGVHRPADDARIREFLLQRGADALAHPGGTLLEHLTRTAALLRDWKAEGRLITAGLCHAIYGTDGFGAQLLPLDARCTLAELVGAQSEAIVYAYASCERAAGYPIPSRPRLRDRFTGRDVPLLPEMVADLLVLSCANELDILLHTQTPSPDCRRLIEHCLPELEPMAAHAVREALHDLPDHVARIGGD